MLEKTFIHAAVKHRRKSNSLGVTNASRSPGTYLNYVSSFLIAVVHRKCWLLCTLLVYLLLQKLLFSILDVQSSNQLITKLVQGFISVSVRASVILSRLQIVISCSHSFCLVPGFPVSSEELRELNDYLDVFALYVMTHKSSTTLSENA